MKMRRCERRCEDEKMRYRPPLLEEPCAQTLSGKKGAKKYQRTVVKIKNKYWPSLLFMARCCTVQGTCIMPLFGKKLIESFQK